MGARLPSMASAYFLHPEKKVVVVCGDEGFILNSQAGFHCFFPLGFKVKKWALKIFIT
jgi:hypothetical protein